jgi:YaaC-like Protein
MPKPTPARPGKSVEINHQPVEFSFWPVVKTTRRYGFQSRVFTSNPWAVIEEGIAQKCPKNLRKSAYAFRDQAQDFFEMGQASKLTYAKPLPFYYSFLNLVKAFVLMAGKGISDYRPQHGLSENARDRQVEGATIKVHSYSSHRRNAFADFYFASTGNQLLQTKSLRLGHLLPQILFGHRLWCSAAGTRDRFVPIRKIEFIENRADRKTWLRAVLKREELRRSSISQQVLLRGSRLCNDWAFVRVDDAEFPEDKFLWIEAVAPRQYTHRASDELFEVAGELKKNLWSSVLLHPPYRRYYLYVAPQNEQSAVLPQLLSMFVVIFFLGSITRYRPHHFERLLETRYGPHLIGAVDEIPMQFIYLLASDMLSREVTKSSIA